MEYYEIEPGVGERVNQYRLRLNETIAALAIAIGVSPSYTSRLLQDKKAWRIDQIKEAARHYGVSVEYICTGRPEKADGQDIIKKQASDTEEISLHEQIKSEIKDSILKLNSLPIEERGRIAGWAIKFIVDSSLEWDE